MSSSRTLSRKFRTSFTCIKPRFDPSIILLYIAASVEQYCDITQVNALPENEGILEEMDPLDDGRSSSYPRVGYRHSGVRLGLSLSSCGRWAEPSHVVFYGSSPPWLHPQFCAVALS